MKDDYMDDLKACVDKTIESINDFTEKLKKLVDILTEDKQPKEKPIIRKRPRAEIGERYYFHDGCGNINGSYDHRSNVDNYRYNFGSYCLTHEDTRKAVEKQLIRQELEDLALEVNTEPEDWENREQLKYSILYDHECDKLSYFCTTGYQQIGQIYCTNKKFFEIALERMGEEKLLKLVGVKK